MLKIILNGKGSSSKGEQGETPVPGEAKVACPDHLVLADLPVAKSIGSVPATSRVNLIGFTVPRKPGEKVHFCVRCDYPIAIYGRLSPCEHAFCLDCAKGDSCYLCGAQVQKIKAIKKGKEKIFICGLSSCLKTFLEENVFKAHIRDNHGAINSSASDDKDDHPILKPIPHLNPPPGFGQIIHPPSESCLRNVYGKAGEHRDGC